MANWQDLFKAFLTNTNDIANTTANPVAMGNPVAAGVAQGAQNAIPWDRLLPLVFPSSHTDIAPQNDPMFGRGMDWNHFFVNHPGGGATPVFQGTPDIYNHPTAYQAPPGPASAVALPAPNPTPAHAAYYMQQALSGAYARPQDVAAVHRAVSPSSIDWNALFRKATPY